MGIALPYSRKIQAHPSQGLIPDFGEQSKECEFSTWFKGTGKYHHKPDSHSYVFQGESGLFHPFHEVLCP